MTDVRPGIAASTRSLALNAAFMKDIKDDNRELKNLWDRLGPMLAHPETASNHWPEIVSLLADLCDQLALHFSLEEAYGYFEEAIETDPNLSLAAETLRSEHAKLFESVRDLADQAADITSDRTEVIAKFLPALKSFRRAFEAHEEAELELILNALDDGLGVGD